MPDAVVEHRPAICTGCQTPLPDQALVVVRERCQVHDLPLVRRQVTEHQALHLRCPTCQAVSAGTFPADVPNRVRYGPRLRALAVYLVERQLVPYGRVRDLFGDLLGAEISVGTMVEWVQQAANALEPVEARIKAALSQVPVLHSDETGVRQAGHLVWAHVASFYDIEWPIFQYRSQAGGTQETKEFRTVGDELFRIVRFFRTRHTWRCVTLIGIAGGGTAAPTLRGAHAERISHLQMIPDARSITTVSDNLLALA